VMGAAQSVPRLGWRGVKHAKEGTEAMTTPPEVSAQNESEGRRRSVLSLVALCVVLALVAFHAFMTAVYDTPDARIRNDVLPGRAAKAYIEPLFLQGYQLFAPNPQDSNRSLLVRAWVEQPDGTLVTTEWVDATAAELAAP